MPGRMPRGLFVVSSTCRGDSTLLVLRSVARGRLLVAGFVFRWARGGPLRPGYISALYIS